MCIGLPMKLVASDGVTGTVERHGHLRHVSLLEAEAESGAVVLVHLGAVLRVLTAGEQQDIEGALAFLDPGVEHHHVAVSEDDA